MLRMLIVNADDFGASPSATDAISEAFNASVVTSTSGMVWMDDTIRAAGVATDCGLPVGLHLNLTLPYTAIEVPTSVRERQRRLTEIFTRDSWWNATERRPDSELLRDVVRDQLDSFCEQFGPPTHIDGHHHVHLHEAVLDMLPNSWPIRPAPRRPADADARLSRRERHLRARFLVTDLTLAFEHVHPALGGAGLDLLARAHAACVEVTTHPRRGVELEALLGSEWRDALSALPLGCYANLAPASIDQN
jgi:predicted glycoside hydrolase/deacetylase ChbG (UPF0249 family)